MASVMKPMKVFHKKEFVWSCRDLDQRILDFATQGRSFVSIHIRSPTSMDSDIAWACWGTQCSNICHSNSLCRLIPWLPLLCLLCCTKCVYILKCLKPAHLNTEKVRRKAIWKLLCLRCVWCPACCVSHWRALLGQQNPVGQSMAESLLVLTTHPLSVWTLSFCFLHISK